MKNKAELEKALSECLIRDRFSLRKKFNDNRLDEKSMAHAVARLNKSQAAAEIRRLASPKPEFPPQLPVSQRVDDLKKAITDNQVVIVAGETGSGKTTQLPKICLELGRGVHGLIGHTQPRRVAARTVGNRIADELNVKFGEEVGYQVRFTDKSSAKTLVKVMTDGILLAESQHDKYLEQYDTIIIDEAHERSLNIDFLLGYIKRILPKRPDLKLIITSATIDLERFSQHFDDAPVIEVSGRTFPVDVHYRPVETKDKQSDSDELMYQAVVDTLTEIAVMERGRRQKGDVLIFLSGEREIRELAHIIRKSDLKHVEVLPLYSRLSVAEQNKVFQTHKGTRVVLATNVAETSLTVPGIRYVIDPGLARISRYSVRSKVQQLPIEPISQASANQRMGRCGRVSEGVCFRLYAEDDFLSRPEFTQPEILRTNLASVILQMLTLNLGSIHQFPFVEKPEDRQINDGYQLLFELQAVDQHRKITKLGRDMSRLPIDLKLSRMLLEAGKQACLTEVLTIVSALAIQDPRDRPHDHQQAADEKHRRHWDEQSDFLALLKLWNFFEKERQELTHNQFRKFCRSNFLSYIRILEWRENHRQLHLICKQMGMVENQQPAEYANVHIALLSGLLGNIGEKGSDNEYLGARNKRHFIFPGSSQFKRKPKWIVSQELTETTRLFGRMVAQIESEWLEPLAKHLVKRNHYEPHFEAKLGQVMGFEEVLLYGVVIVKKRKIDFAKVDSDKARQIFIQSGLVEQQLQSKSGFYRNNCRLISEIEQLESKSRKRDILVDDYTVFRFYDEKLPETVFNGKTLDKFRKQAEIEQPKLLFMDREDLMRTDTALSEAEFPSKLTVGDTPLNLDYHFDPQHEHDGVSLNVPLAILRQVSKTQLDWVIPGLLEEKCLALIRSLPKSLRKNFVPAPDYAARVAKDLEYDGSSLVEIVAKRLFRLSGKQIETSDFNVAAIDQHLSMNIKVLNEKGQVLASDRNLEVLLDQFGQKAAQGFKQQNPHKLAQTGLVDWSFTELPEEIDIKQAGMQIKGFPALVDKQDSVAIEIIDNRIEAAQLNDLGLQRLMMLKLVDQKKYLEKNIPGFDKFALFYATRGSRAELLSDITEAIFRYTFIESKPAVRDLAAFNERLMEKSRLMEVANRLTKTLAEVLKRVMQIEGHLKQHKHPKLAKTHNDVKHQLQLLVGKQFLRSVPLTALEQYPRYLKAIEYRLDKLQGNLEKDEQHVVTIAEFWRRIEHSPNDFAYREYRWMIEELRISLFAQSVGTSKPISAKRLEKIWQTVAK